MEYTKEEIEDIIRKAFKAGEQWGVTYSTWFIPTKAGTEEKIQEVVTEVFQDNFE